MPQNTDALIGLDDLLTAGLDLNDEESVRCAMLRLQQIEPDLAGFLDREVVQMAGRLVLSGASSMVCQEMTVLLLTIVLTTFTAQRLASNRLWSEAMEGSPLANLPSPIPPPDEEKLPF